MVSVADFPELKNIENSQSEFEEMLPQVDGALSWMPSLLPGIRLSWGKNLNMAIIYLLQDYVNAIWFRENPKENYEGLTRGLAVGKAEHLA